MRKLMYSLMVATLSLGLTAGFTYGQDRGSQKDELESRAHEIIAGTYSVRDAREYEHVYEDCCAAPDAP